MSEERASWPDKNANIIACRFLGLNPEEYSIFMMSLTAQCVDDELLNDNLEGEDDYWNEPLDRITEAIHDVQLPPGFCMVGVQKKDGTGDQVFAVIDFSQKEKYVPS